MYWGLAVALATWYKKKQKRRERMVFHANEGGVHL